MGIFHSSRNFVSTTRKRAKSWRLALFSARRTLRGRRQWRIVGDVNNKIKASGEKNGGPHEIDAWSRAVCWTADGVTPSSKRYNFEWTALPRARARPAARKAFTCCKINFSPEISVIVVLSYTGAFYRCEIKRCKPILTGI